MATTLSCSVATTLAWHSLSWHSAKLPYDIARDAGAELEAGHVRPTRVLHVGPTRALMECHAGGRSEGDADGVGEDGGVDEGLLGLETLVVRGSGGRALLELPLVLHRLVLPVFEPLFSCTHSFSNNPHTHALVHAHSHTLRRTLQDRLVSLLQGRFWGVREESTLGLHALWLCSTEATRARLDESLGGYLELLLQQSQQGPVAVAHGAETEQALSEVLKLVHFLQECPPACQRVLIDSFLQTWDGQGNKNLTRFILDLLPFLRPMSWHQLSAGVLQPLVPVFASCNPLHKARFLRSLGALICRWMRHTPTGGQTMGSTQAPSLLCGQTMRSTHAPSPVVQIGFFFSDAVRGRSGRDAGEERTMEKGHGGVPPCLGHAACSRDVPWVEQLERLLLFFDRLAVLGACPPTNKGCCCVQSIMLSTTFAVLPVSTGPLSPPFLCMHVYRTGHDGGTCGNRNGHPRFL